MVMGERCRDLAEDLRALNYTFLPDGMARVDGRVPTEGSLMRAFLRAEAELLVTDADAMREGAYSRRTDRRRRADAFLLLVLRFTAAAQDGGPGVAVPPTVRSTPARKRKPRSRRR